MEKVYIKYREWFLDSKGNLHYVDLLEDESISKGTMTYCTCCKDTLRLVVETMGRDEIKRIRKPLNG